MTDLPDPLTPSDCDLRNFPFMPIWLQRLKSSRAWLLCKRRPALAFYLINLWTASWHSCPAASLEDDDLVLADIAMCDDETWRSVKDDALRVWVRCSDGRLYHPVVAELARGAWKRKLAQNAQTEAARKARAANRNKPTISVTETVTTSVTESNREGEGEGEREYRSSSLRSDDLRASAPRSAKGRSTKDRPRKHPFPQDAFDRWYAAYPLHVGKRDAQKAFAKIEAADDIEFQILLDGVTAYRKTKPESISFAHPATWLNGRRWEDDPTGKRTAASVSPVIDFRNGMTAPLDTVAACYARQRWPQDWGPKPGEPGCLVPAEHLSTIMERAAA